MVVEELCSRASKMTQFQVINTVNTFYALQRAKKLSSFFNPRLMNIMLESCIEDKITSLDKMPIILLLKVLSSNNYGYLPYYEKINERIANYKDRLNLIDCNVLLNSFIRVDRLGIETHKLINHNIDRILDEVKVYSWID
jgi:hypothetical protein